MRIQLLDKLKGSNHSQIDLVSLDIKDDELIELLQAIRASHPDLKELYLSHNQIGDKGAIILAKELACFASLSFIDLQFNHIDKDGAQALFSLRTAFPKMTLALHGNQISNAQVIDEIEHQENKPLRPN